MEQVKIMLLTLEYHLILYGGIHHQQQQLKIKLQDLVFLKTQILILIILVVVVLILVERLFVYYNFKKK